MANVAIYLIWSCHLDVNKNITKTHKQMSKVGKRIRQRPKKGSFKVRKYMFEKDEKYLCRHREGELLSIKSTTISYGSTLCSSDTKDC